MAQILIIVEIILVAARRVKIQWTHVSTVLIFSQRLIYFKIVSK